MASLLSACFNFLCRNSRLTEHGESPIILRVLFLNERRDLPKEKVRVIAPFIGGGFGSKGFTWANTFLAQMPAKLVNRPVKIVLTRSFQMFTCAGRRTSTIQKISLGADGNGKISSGKP